MKRYLLFSYAEYYPGGGLSDVIYSADSVKEIIDWLLLPTHKYSPLSDYSYIWDRIEDKEYELDDYYKERDRQILLSLEIAKASTSIPNERLTFQYHMHWAAVYQFKKACEFAWTGGNNILKANDNIERAFFR